MKKQRVAVHFLQRQEWKDQYYLKKTVQYIEIDSSLM